MTKKEKTITIITVTLGKIFGFLIAAFVIAAFAVYAMSPYVDYSFSFSNILDVTVALISIRGIIKLVFWDAKE